MRGSVANWLVDQSIRHRPGAVEEGLAPFYFSGRGSFSLFFWGNFDLTM